MMSRTWLGAVPPMSAFTAYIELNPTVQNFKTHLLNSNKWLKLSTKINYNTSQAKKNAIAILCIYVPLKLVSKGLSENCACIIYNHQIQCVWKKYIVWVKLLQTIGHYLIRYMIDVFYNVYYSSVFISSLPDSRYLYY